MKYQKLKEEAFHSMCRQCINEQYGLRLETKDCYYLPYQELCSRCGNIKNIVAGISRQPVAIVLCPAKSNRKS